MCNYLALFILLILTPVAKAQETITFDIEEQYKKAVELMSANQYEKALDYIYECHRSDGRNLDYTNKLGYCYFRLGNYKEAKYNFESALKMDSINTYALSNLASIYEREVNYFKAQSLYNQLIEMDSTNSYYFKQNAAIALKTGDLLNAIKLYTKAHQLNENDQVTIIQLAEIYLSMDAPEYAETFAKKGMEIDSSNIQMLYTNARVKNELKQYPRVVDLVEKAMLQGDSTIYYERLLSVAYLQVDSLEKALFHLNRMVDLKKDTEHTHHYLALAYDELGDFEKSKIHYEKAIEKGISKKVPRYHTDLAILYELNKDYKKAYDHYLAANRYSDDPKLLFHIAQNADNYFKDKNIALRYYQKYIKTKDSTFKEYTEQRITQLKEDIHFQTRK